MIKNKIKKSSLFKDKVGFIFYNNKIVHIVMIVLTVMATSSNLFVKEVRADVAKESKLYKVVQDTMGLDIGSEEKIVQKANRNKSKRKNYIDTDALVVANIPKITDKEKQTDNMMMLGHGNTLASTAVLGKEVSKKRSETTEYTVEEGDSLGLLAGKFGISLSTLLWANDLNSESTIQPGQNLKIPQDSGLLYVVKSGDTLDDIIQKHKADKKTTLEKNKGKIDENENIVVGTEILLAGGKPYSPPAPTPSYSSSYSGSSSSGSSGGSLYTSGGGSSVTGGTLNWPSSCHRISQGVGWGHIAIDINCGFNNPIFAAESGVVSTIANSGNGYGNYAMMNHGSGLQTLYGHLSSFTVQNGQYVSRGQQIGWEGSTGWSTGPHLHFEVRVNGVKQNPWNYL